MSPDVLPLAAAGERRKGKPGRPRKVETPEEREERATQRLAAKAAAIAAAHARLLDLDCSAKYLGVSAWSVRDLEANGTLKRVRIPLARGRDLRKLLFDRADLDGLIETWKEAGR
jgi:hypothetical protein